MGLPCCSLPPRPEIVSPAIAIVVVVVVVVVAGGSCVWWPGGGARRGGQGRFPQAGETDIGRELVRAGWAVALPTPDYAAEEAEARSEGCGLWQGSFQRPDEWRRAAMPMPSQAMPRQ